jgi:DNA-binding PadR family transcriptional regulator
MGMFDEQAIVDYGTVYRLLAVQEKQTFIFRLQKTNRSCRFYF